MSHAVFSGIEIVVENGVIAPPGLPFFSTNERLLALIEKDPECVVKLELTAIDPINLDRDLQRLRSLRKPASRLTHLTLSVSWPPWFHSQKVPYLLLTPDMYPKLGYLRLDGLFMPPNCALICQLFLLGLSNFPSMTACMEPGSMVAMLARAPNLECLIIRNYLHCVQYVGRTEPHEFVGLLPRLRDLLLEDEEIKMHLFHRDVVNYLANLNGVQITSTKFGVA